MNRGFVSIALMIAALVVVAAGAGGWWYVSQPSGTFEAQFPTLQESTSIETQAALKPSAPKPKPTTQPTPVANSETANWKTYRNDAYAYELQYPPNWYLDSSSLGYVVITNYDSSSGGHGGAPSEQNIRIVIHIRTELTDAPCTVNTPCPRTETQIRESTLSSNETVESLADKMRLTNRQNLSLDGIQAIRGKTPEDVQGISSIDVVSIYNRKGYYISYIPYGSKLGDVFDTILSTFTFLR